MHLHKSFFPNAQGVTRHTEVYRPKIHKQWTQLILSSLWDSMYPLQVTMATLGSLAPYICSVGCQIVTEVSDQ